MKKQEGHILIVDDDPAILTTAEVILSHHYTHVDALTEPEHILPRLKKKEYELLIMDMNFSPGKRDGREGIHLIKKIKESFSSLSIIMITAYEDLELAVEALKSGAQDFIIKPWNNQKFLASVTAGIRQYRTSHELLAVKAQNQALMHQLSGAETKFIYASESMKLVMDAAQKVAETDASILLLGENGTGKDVLAREIHNMSPRREMPFIKIDLGAIPENLFESELFGHVKGSFTGAIRDKTGKFELAQGGTLFLDEVGNIPLSLQAKLLTVIQDKRMSPVGAEKEVELDVRIISATNADLREKTSLGEFREDLYYRLRMFELLLPPLRKREEDIKTLAEYFREELSHKYGKKTGTVSKKMLDHLCGYTWPGNIRELKHAMERAVILSKEGKLLISDLGISPTERKTQTHATHSLDEVIRNTVKDSLLQNNWNISKTASDLGISRSKLYREIQKYGLTQI